MKFQIPLLEDVRRDLSALGPKGMRELGTRSGVPFDTLMKIRTGYTPNPGIETVRKFYDHLHQTPETVSAGKEADTTKQ